jgi:tetratricopeptide (TPR) repeat protein
MMENALRCHRTGQLAEAERIYRQILSIDAGHSDSLNLLGMIASQSGRHETAIELIGRAIRRAKHNPVYHCSLGIAQQAQGLIQDAIASYRRALTFNSDYAEAHNNLGIALTAQGRLAEAVSHFERVLVLDPARANTHNDLAVALQAQGRIHDAISHYEQAIVLQPDHAAAHNNLGLVLSEQGRVDDAIVHYASALAAQPNYANAHNNMGSALLLKGKTDSATVHFTRAIAIDPNHAQAHNNLGNILNEQGRRDEAIRHYERAVILKPDYADAHSNLGIALAAEGRTDDAIAHCLRAVVLNPNHAQAHNNLGNIFKEQGRFDDAMAHYASAIAIKPDYAEAHFNRAEILTFHDGDASLTALEELAGRSGVPENQALQIHFALAKALEDTGEYSRAFEQLRRGNDLKRRQLNYDETSVVNLFRSVSTVFESSLFDRLERNGDPSPTPIFVLGMPRSGSSLIEQILASHPRIQAAGELTELDTAIGNVLNAAGVSAPYPKCVPSLDGALLRRIGETYLARLPALEGGKTRITDKLPGNFLHVGLIRLILPNAKIIHTMRDPMDTCVSCYSKLFTSGADYSYDLAELGRCYRGYFDVMNHWRSVLPPGSVLDVSYEKVVDDIEGEARRLIDYCGLPWDDSCIAFHRNSRPVRTASAVQVRKPLFRSSIQRWRRYEADLAPLLNELRDIC